jgi:hypothetical protein
VRAWLSFREVVIGFLGKRRTDNYKNLVEELLFSYQKPGCNMSVKIHFFPENCGSVSDERGERFHQDITAMEGRYKGKWSPSVLPDYCWTLMRDSPNSEFNRQEKKTRLLHLSYTQPLTYDVVQVRDNSLKIVANEAFLL